MKRPPYSLTTRLTTLYTAVSLLVLASMSSLVLYATQRNFVQQDADFLQEKFQVIHTFMEGRDAQDIHRVLDALQRSHHGLHVQLRAGEQLLFGDAALVPPPESRKNRQGILSWKAGELALRGLEQPLPLHTEAAPATAPYQLLLALETNRKNQFLRHMTRALALFVLLATLASGLLSWLAARAGLRPLRIMRERAMRVNGQQWQARMPEAEVPAEMQGLAQSINQMLDRLQSDFERLQQFSGDLAHELRTPLNSLLMQAEVILAHPRDAAEYQEALASTTEELQRFARMIGDMLFLAHAGQGAALPQTETVDLHEQALQLCDFYDALAESRQMQLRVSGQGQLQGDPLMVRRALGNLLSNALRYGAPHSTVDIRIQQEAEALTLSVCNSGETIAPEHLPRLFDRFYRVDRSRQRPDAEGSGLGLAICQAIVQAHGGEIDVQSADGRTCFSARFAQRPHSPA